MKNDTIWIVPAASEDLPIAAELRKTMAMEMGNDWDKEHPGWQQRFVEYLGQKQQGDAAQVFYARSQSEIVGMLTVSLVDDYHAYVRDKKSGRVNAVYVKPSHRRRGIAREMMQRAMDWLRAKNCVEVRLHTSDAGQPFYESMGFRPRHEMELFL